MNRTSTQKARRVISGGLLCYFSCPLLPRLPVPVTIHRLQALSIKVEQVFSVFRWVVLLDLRRDPNHQVIRDSLFQVAQFYDLFSHISRNPNLLQNLFNRTLLEFLHKPLSDCSHAAAAARFALSACFCFHLCRAFSMTIPNTIDPTWSRTHFTTSSANSSIFTQKGERCAPIEIATVKEISLVLISYCRRVNAARVANLPKAVKRQRPSKMPMKPSFYRRFKSSPSRP
jgi:hypothetical protein